LGVEAVKFVAAAWTVVCAAIVILAFFVAPAWDTGTEGYEPISGAGLFLFVTIATAAAWGGGIVLFLAIDLLVDVVRRRFVE
jgi:hypothetical protein